MIMQHINTRVKAKARMNAFKYDITEQERSINSSIGGQIADIQYRGASESTHAFMQIKYYLGFEL